jgi:hypothetical protein
MSLFFRMLLPLTSIFPLKYSSVAQEELWVEEGTEAGQRLPRNIVQT